MPGLLIKVKQPSLALLGWLFYWLNAAKFDIAIRPISAESDYINQEQHEACPQ